jgi:hypothetical protein
MSSVLLFLLRWVSVCHCQFNLHPCCSQELCLSNWNGLSQDLCIKKSFDLQLSFSFWVASQVPISAFVALLPGKIDTKGSFFFFFFFSHEKFKILKKLQDPVQPNPSLGRVKEA